MSSRTLRKAVAVLAVAASALAGPGTLAAAQEGPDETATPVVESTAHLPSLDAIDPVRFSYDDAIVEHEFITTRTGTPAGTGTGLAPSDTQIWIDIIRPDTDEPVPTILISSPYYNVLGRGWRGELKSPTQGPSNPGLAATRPLGAGTIETAFPEWYDEYFVKRGYAVALMDLRGTRNSSGCQVYGDRDEVLDTVDAIDFLASQDWSNGKVGMTGGSYDGTIAFGAAAEHAISGQVDGALGAIIPIRAIGRWYDYHFMNGVQSSGHRLTPALFTAVLAGADTQTSGTDDLLYPYHLAERKACIGTVGAAVTAGYASPYQDTADAFWTERDFITNAADYDTATFVIHGLFDFNVRTHTAGYAWDALQGTDVPRKLWWLNMDHADPHIPTSQDAGSHIMPFPVQQKFIDATHRWYLQFLKGVEAGALEMPLSETQQWDGTFATGDQWPPATTDLVLHPAEDGTLVAEGEAADGAVTWADGPTSNAPGSVTFISDVFEDATRLAGQIAFELDLHADGPDTTVAVKIASVPDGVDPAAASDSADWSVDVDPAHTITYAWARAWYRDSIAPRGISSPTGGGPVSDTFELDFASSHTDFTIPEGHRLAITFDNAIGGTEAANTGDNVTMTLGASASRILLPVISQPVAAPAPAPAPAPEPAPVPLPATGGGLAVVGLALAASATRFRRR